MPQIQIIISYDKSPRGTILAAMIERMSKAVRNALHLTAIMTLTVSCPFTLLANPMNLYPQQLTKISRVTGASPSGEMLPNPNHTDTQEDVFGTDLGILWTGASGETMVVFGDSYGSGWGKDGGGPPEGQWRSNILAFAANTDPAAGLVLNRFIDDENGVAREIIGSKKDKTEETVIPTAAVSVGSRDYIYYMSVHSWGRDGYWRTNYGGIAFSDDHGQTWAESKDAVWNNNDAGTETFQQVAAVKRDGYVYVFGTANGRQGDAYLARVPEDQILDKPSYRYWDGNGWVQQQSESSAVIEAPVSELSVAYNTLFRRWIMIYLDEDQHAIIFRSAPELTGPWSAKTVLADYKDYPGLYGGYIDPRYNSGSDLYFTMSQWHPYNVFWMHAKLAMR